MYHNTKLIQQLQQRYRVIHYFVDEQNEPQRIRVALLSFTINWYANY